MKTRISLLLLIVSMFVYTNLNAHCEVPCGIYNDLLRIKLINEHITTIEKSMKEIERLSKEKEVNYNQLVRWINTKEEHANKIQHIVSQYFMTQRIKIKTANDAKAFSKYTTQLTLAHKLLILAMKAKQSTDVKYVKDLRTTVKAFSESYFSKEDLKHLDEHKHEH